MSETTWADRVAAATSHSTPRQVGAIPVLYPLLEAMQVRETINALRWTKADVDLGRLVEVLTLNRSMASPTPQPRWGVGRPDGRGFHVWAEGRAVVRPTLWACPG